MELVLIHFALKYNGDFYKIFEALQKKEFVSPAERTLAKEQIEAKGIKAITIIDDDYPDMLKKIDKPPFVLFYKGNKSLLKNSNKVLVAGCSIDNQYVDGVNSLAKQKTTLVSNFFSSDASSNIFEIFVSNKRDLIFVVPDGINSPIVSKLENNFKDEEFLFISEKFDKLEINEEVLLDSNRITVGLVNELILTSAKENCKSIRYLKKTANNQNKNIHFVYEFSSNKNEKVCSLN